MKRAYMIRTFWKNRDEQADFHRTHRRVARNVVEALVQEISHNIGRMLGSMGEEGFYVSKVRVVEYLGSVVDEDWAAFHGNMKEAISAIHAARCFAKAYAPTLGPAAGPWPEPNVEAVMNCVRNAMLHRALAKEHL